MSTTMTCHEAAMIMRADIARFCNEPQDPEMVRRADAVAAAHWHGFCPCVGFAPVPEATI